eukprot:CAMPEP_0181224890 /NCGR_PEP_ID=MMETSP1096-20121128/31385_1 /TAXON_ID=156174 ORGANISM="Chrysochromulina ericina, Strain CCMP281" /NCGR_SAMPLE_ID=MMETSP1096 /ASSEMBLY_ACC=CAM_ASM_000453 /LENGTH=91 /DNA_ID=CAMNT_0023318037 /DNA_START=98 /DNA_END=371 /DNA_ORIENTATION=+
MTSPSHPLFAATPPFRSQTLGATFLLVAHRRTVWMAKGAVVVERPLVPTVVEFPPAGACVVIVLASCDEEGSKAPRVHLVAKAAKVDVDLG